MAKTPTQTTLLDLDALMDQNMDAVETLPDYVTPPAGNYQLVVKEAKTEQYSSKSEPTIKANRIRVIYAVEETLEVENGNLPVADGSLFSETYMATEEGLKYFKKTAMGILGVKDFEGASLRDVIQGIKDASFKARINIRTTKDPVSGQVFENIQLRPIASE
jgi:hypothetical protein